MSRLSLVAAALAVALAIPARAAEPPKAYKLIVHPASPVESLGREKVSQIFLKKTTHWEDGTRAMPVDLPADSPVRERFTREVHRKSVSAVRSYWNQMVFSGREVPPVEKANDEEALAYVRATPGAVAYVSAAAAATGVKVVTIVE